MSNQHTRNYETVEYVPDDEEIRAALDEHYDNLSQLPPTQFERITAEVDEKIAKVGQVVGKEGAILGVTGLALLPSIIGSFPASSADTKPAINNHRIELTVTEDHQTVQKIAQEFGTSEHDVISGNEDLAQRYSQDPTAEIPPGSHLQIVTYEPQISTQPGVAIQNQAAVESSNPSSPNSAVSTPEATTPAASSTATPTPELSLNPVNFPAKAAVSPESTPTTTPAPEIEPVNNHIYLIGDSLTVGMEGGGLSNLLTANGWQVNQIDATVGYSVERSIPKVESDAAQIKAANTVVVELGTNDCELYLSDPTCQSSLDFEANIQNMEATIHSINPDAQIMWVNMYTNKGNQYTSINTAISAMASKLNIKVLDWAGEVAANPSMYQFDPELGVHEVYDQGYVNEATWLAGAIGKAPEAEVTPTTTTPTTPTTTATTTPTTVPAAPTPSPTATKPAPSTTPSVPNKAKPTTTKAEVAPTTTTAPAPAEGDKPYPNINADQFVAFLTAELTQESHGHWTDPNNPWMCSGGYQMDPSMWANSFGVAYAYEATPEQQTQIAIQHFAAYYNMFEGNWKDMAMAWYAGPGFLADHYDIYARQNGGKYPSLSDYGDSVMSYMQNFQANPSTIDPNILNTAVGIGIVPSWYKPAP